MTLMTRIARQTVAVRYRVDNATTAGRHAQHHEGLVVRVTQRVQDHHRVHPIKTAAKANRSAVSSSRQDHEAVAVSDDRVAIVLRARTEASTEGKTAVVAADRVVNVGPYTEGSS